MRETTAPKLTALFVAHTQDATTQPTAPKPTVPLTVSAPLWIAHHQLANLNLCVLSHASPLLVLDVTATKLIVLLVRSGHPVLLPPTAHSPIVPEEVAPLVHVQHQLAMTFNPLVLNHAPTQLVWVQTASKPTALFVILIRTVVSYKLAQSTTVPKTVFAPTLNVSGYPPAKIQTFVSNLALILHASATAALKPTVLLVTITQPALQQPTAHKPMAQILLLALISLVRTNICALSQIILNHVKVLTVLKLLCLGVVLILCVLHKLLFAHKLT